MLVGYACSLGAFAFLPLLPDQKDDTQRRIHSRPHSAYYAVGTFAILGLGLAYSATTELLSIFPSTACMPIVGGSGCGDAEPLDAHAD